MEANFIHNIQQIYLYLLKFDGSFFFLVSSCQLSNFSCGFISNNEGEKEEAGEGGYVMVLIKLKIDRINLASNSTSI